MWNVRERQRRAAGAVSVLQQVARLAGRIPGRRKALIYLGEGIDIDIGPAVGATTPQGELTAEMEDFIATAARSNLHVYAIDPRRHDRAEAIADRASPGDLVYHQVLERELQASVDTLRLWADETGCVSVVQANDVESALRRIAAENSRYYVLAYPSDKSDDGRFHRIDVRVKRPGVTVRARCGFLAARPAPRGNLALDGWRDFQGPVEIGVCDFHGTGISTAPDTHAFFSGPGARDLVSVAAGLSVAGPGRMRGGSVGISRSTAGEISKVRWKSP